MQLKAIRADLDGSHLVDDTRTRAWLVFHGLRHHITSSEVYDSLFRPGLAFECNTDIENIAEGPDLGSGTCLVSNAESGEIFLVFGAPSINIRKHAIETHETFSALGFNDQLVTVVPRILLSAIPAGRPIRLDVAL